MKKIRLAVISDLHYRKHENNLACRPATSIQGVHADPMASLSKFLSERCLKSSGVNGEIADYLLCPGDITNGASQEAFDEGWEKLKKLKDDLGATHLITSTGNHEVDSRADSEHDKAGNAEISIDPVQSLQRHPDYPSTALEEGDRRWVYWGRGYEFIEEKGVLFLLINSSHYHGTTRQNEFERGRIGDVALKCLRDEMKIRIDRSNAQVYVALLHHHPIPHQDLDIDLGKIEMDNGAKLMELFAESKVAWLVIHGHKHHPRLVRGQSSTGSVVFAAGSFGAQLNGTLAAKTRPQFYLIDAHVVDQQSQPEARGTVRAFSWNGSSWEASTKYSQGLPDQCGYRVPQLDLSALSNDIKTVLADNSMPFMQWPEVIEQVPNLAYLLPEEAIRLRDSLRVAKVNAVWPEEMWFPTDLAQDNSK
jgi:predicted MPP superfamily phosphohydrolase